MSRIIPVACHSPPKFIAEIESSTGNSVPSLRMAVNSSIFSHDRTGSGLSEQAYALIRLTAIALGNNQAVQLFSDDLLRAVTEHLLRHLVPEINCCVGTYANDGIVLRSR